MFPHGHTQITAEELEEELITHISDEISYKLLYHPDYFTNATPEEIHHEIENLCYEATNRLVKQCVDRIQKTVLESLKNPKCN
jgi:hypothetical protein